MGTLTTEHEFDIASQRLWALIADFGNIRAWWPADSEIKIREVVLEGEGVGMTRHIYNEGMPTAVSEQLDYLDPETLTWKLSLVGDRPAGLIRYRATGHIHEIGPGKCRIEYCGDYEAADGRETEAREFLHAVYALMFDGLQQALNRS